MEVRAPSGQYRVIELDPIDTLTSSSGHLWKDCKTLDEALDLAASNDEFYLRIYICKPSVHNIEALDTSGRSIMWIGEHAPRTIIERAEILTRAAQGLACIPRR